MKAPLTLDAIAKMVNPMVHGWINYYGRYRRSELSLDPLLLKSSHAPSLAPSRRCIAPGTSNDG